MTPAADHVSRIAERYERFARHEAAGVSPTYERWALAVAADESVLAFLAALSHRQQQPNALFGAVRLLFGTPPDPAELLALIALHGPRIRAVLETHHVQTNEPARCATLLPSLARLPQPLALIEVGASAGLCLS